MFDRPSLKLSISDIYEQKLTEILCLNSIKQGIEIAIMEFFVKKEGIQLKFSEFLVN